jgi:plastocyanin
MNMKHLLIAVLVCGGIALLVFAMLLSFVDDEPPQNSAVVSAEGEAAVVVVRTPEGYEPKDITIKKGDIVEWVNESGEYHWPASDLHPTHGVYPAFDPLTAIAPGQSWKFRFDQVGEWKYHDHIRANKIGSVTVTE